MDGCKTGAGIMCSTPVSNDALDGHGQGGPKGIGDLNHRHDDGVARSYLFPRQGIERVDFGWGVGQDQAGAANGVEDSD